MPDTDLPELDGDFPHRTFDRTESQLVMPRLRVVQPQPRSSSEPAYPALTSHEQRLRGEFDLMSASVPRRICGTGTWNGTLAAQHADNHPA